MKVHDFAWQVAERTMELLEQNQHYKIAENHRKQIHATILKEVDEIIRKATEAGSAPKGGKNKK